LAALDGSFTVATQVQGSDFEQTSQVVLRDTTGNLRLSVRDKQWFMTLDGVHVNSAAPQLLDLKWDHVVWRYDSETGEQALFLDGYLKNAGETTGEMPDHARPRPTTPDHARPRPAAGGLHGPCPLLAGRLGRHQHLQSSAV